MSTKPHTEKTKQHTQQTRATINSISLTRLLNVHVASNTIERVRLKQNT